MCRKKICLQCLTKQKDVLFSIDYRYAGIPFQVPLNISILWVEKVIEVESFVTKHYSCWVRRDNVVSNFAFRGGSRDTYCAVPWRYIATRSNMLHALIWEITAVLAARHFNGSEWKSGAAGLPLSERLYIKDFLCPNFKIQLDRHFKINCLILPTVLCTFPRISARRVVRIEFWLIEKCFSTNIKVSYPNHIVNKKYNVSRFINKWSVSGYRAG